MNEQLKPCPFCGAAATIRERKDEDLWSHDMVVWTHIYCIDCDVGFDLPPGAEPSVVARWNTRVETKAQPLCDDCMDLSILTQRLSAVKKERDYLIGKYEPFLSNSEEQGK